MKNTITSFITSYRHSFAMEQAITVEDITRGYCDAFASVLLDKFPQAILQECSEIGHTWVLLDNRHYDSDHPAGVLDWCDLVRSSRELTNHDPNKFWCCSHPYSRLRGKEAQA